MTRIVVAAPVRPGTTSGNDVTAGRWADHLRALGHEVEVVPIDESAMSFAAATQNAFIEAEVLIALHARRCATVANWWSLQRPDQPLVVGLAGTDLYADMPEDIDAMRTVEAADALIVLQSAAVDRLADFDERWGAKAHVIHQSVDDLPERNPHPDELRIVVLAHLRAVKDPLLTGRAAERLPANSRVTVHHAGRAHDAEWAEAATDHSRTNPRYTWHGELTPDKAMQLLATGHYLACTSTSEGGANVVTEAIAMGVPVIGTEIDGNTGLLGADYPALVPVGDEQALCDLLQRLETDPHLVAELQRRTNDLAQITKPQAERDAIAALIDALPA